MKLTNFCHIVIPILSSISTMVILSIMINLVYLLLEFKQEIVVACINGPLGFDLHLMFFQNQYSFFSSAWPFLTTDVPWSKGFLHNGQVLDLQQLFEAYHLGVQEISSVSNQNFYASIEVQSCLSNCCFSIWNSSMLLNFCLMMQLFDFS